MDDLGAGDILKELRDQYIRRDAVLVSVLDKSIETSRKPLMQEAAAGGSQIHFTPALAFDRPITTPSRMPMVMTVAT
jgi:hypothetical protein